MPTTRPSHPSIANNPPVPPARIYTEGAYYQVPTVRDNTHGQLVLGLERQGLRCRPTPLRGGATQSSPYLGERDHFGAQGVDVALC